MSLRIILVRLLLVRINSFIWKIIFKKSLIEYGTWLNRCLAQDQKYKVEIERSIDSQLVNHYAKICLKIKQEWMPYIFERSIDSQLVNHYAKICLKIQQEWMPYIFEFVSEFQFKNFQECLCVGVKRQNYSIHSRKSNTLIRMRWFIYESDYHFEPEVTGIFLCHSSSWQALEETTAIFTNFRASRKVCHLQ